jgi:aconitate hydratase
MSASQHANIATYYQGLPQQLDAVRQWLGRSALTYAEKVLYSHLLWDKHPDTLVRGQTMLTLQPDRVAMQDATAQMAMLQFMQSGRGTVAVPSTIHCDHLIRAQSGATADVNRAIDENQEVYEFLRSAAAKYGIGFWKPGSGIIHQVVLEQYAFPAGLIIGTDSHTPNAGGLGMVAIGVGGADAAEVMSGLPWSVRAPYLVGVRLTGQLNGWSSPKDVILYLLGQLTTSGGTNKIIEYFGPGTASISCTGKGTITNMGAELGATTSVFPYDARMAKYLRATQREEIAAWADDIAPHLQADPDVLACPENYYDTVIDIDLAALEPYIVGPHTPDKARPISQFASEVSAQNYPVRWSAALIGSCTNSSYEDMERAASVARQATAHGLKAQTGLLITPGSEQVYQTIQRDGQMDNFNAIGATVLANACGPCIGNWDRTDLQAGTSNAILTSFNRNFPKRNDGRAETMAFIASPEVVIAMALAGRTDFNPLTDALPAANGQDVKLAAPQAPELPAQGFAFSRAGFLEPPANRDDLRVQVAPASNRLELLSPFAAWDGRDYEHLPILLKTLGQTTTDHISPAGKDWLPLRGHLSGISHNMLLGAVDAETGKPAEPVAMMLCGVMRGVSPWALQAMTYRDQPAEGASHPGSVIVGDQNYGEGSSREHAAMSPRLLGVRVVITRSFARIHETNLKKQGILPLTFANPEDYQQLRKGDRISIQGLASLTPGKPVAALVYPAAANGNSVKPPVSVSLRHTLTHEQIAWFQAGSALNAVNRPKAATA